LFKKEYLEAFGVVQLRRGVFEKGKTPELGGGRDKEPGKREESDGKGKRFANKGFLRGMVAIDREV